jgi:hypothetical protein
MRQYWRTCAEEQERMTPDELQKIQRNHDVVANSEGNHEAALDARVKDLHTCLPGIISKFDPDTQTAEVQPAIKRIFTETGAVHLPLCVDVPVCFPGGGDWFFTFPVKAGDECILIFSERCIDGWAIDGEISEPEDYRQHDLSDAVAIVGINSQPKKLASFNSTDAEIRNRAASV